MPDIPLKHTKRPDFLLVVVASASFFGTGMLCRVGRVCFRGLRGCLPGRRLHHVRATRAVRAAKERPNKHRRSKFTLFQDVEKSSGSSQFLDDPYIYMPQKMYFTTVVLVFTPPLPSSARRLAALPQKPGLTAEVSRFAFFRALPDFSGRGFRVD